MSRINAWQAIEFIAFQWEPYINENEEILAGRNRILFFSTNLETKTFLIKRAGLKLEQYIKTGCLGFRAVIDENTVNPVKLEESLKNGKISYADFVEALRCPSPSNVILCKNFIEGDYSKEAITKKDYWNDNFNFVFCEDISYYKDPYKQRYLKFPTSEYDLFYIKTNGGYDIRYLDLDFEFQNLKEVCKNCIEQKPLTQKEKKELINQKVKKAAKKIKKEKPSISNCRAANEIQKQMRIQSGQYPSLSQIYNLIDEIIPKQKRGKINR